MKLVKVEFLRLERVLQSRNRTGSSVEAVGADTGRVSGNRKRNDGGSVDIRNTRVPKQKKEWRDAVW